MADERSRRQRRVQLLARDHDRPDKEYTNGDKVTVEFRRRPGGEAVREATSRRTGNRAVGRAMPNDSFSRRPGHVHAEAKPRAAQTPDWREDRPYAALAVREGRGARGGRGVDASGQPQHRCLVGPPALGSFAQRTAHRLSGVYTQEPDRLGHAGRPSNRSSCDGPGARGATRAGPVRDRAVMDFMPQVGASIGNILTEGGGRLPAAVTGTNCRARGESADGAARALSSSISWGAFAVRRWRTTSRLTVTR